MSRIGIGYEIGRFTGVCAATGEPLAPGAPCVATLSEAVSDDGSPSEGFIRRDFAPDAWDAGHRPERLFSFWRTAVPHPDAPRRLLVDDGVLLDLLVRLEGDQRAARLAFRFVLALILLRRRQLRQVGRERVEMMLPPRTPPLAESAPDSDAEAADTTGATEPDASVRRPISQSVAQSVAQSVPQSVPQSVEVWLLMPRGAAEGEAPLRVIDPSLGPEDVAAISEQLGEVLQGDL